MTTYTEDRIASLAAHAQHPNPESREGRYLIKLMEKLGVDRLPLWEEIFASHFPHDLSAVPLDRIAVFNDSSAFDNATSQIGKIMKEVANFFGTCPNVLNPHAEIHEAQVQKVLEDLLMDRKLYNPIKAFVISDHPNPEVESYYQVFDGRHRMAALAILFGFKVRIPIWLDSDTYARATSMTMRMNTTRKTFKMETLAVNDLSAKAHSEDLQEQLTRCKGFKKRVTTWLESQLLISKNTTDFPKISLVVTEKPNRNIHSLTVVNCQNILRNMLDSCTEEELKDLAALKAKMGVGLKIFSAFFSEIPRATKENWSYVIGAYSSLLIGTLISEEITNPQGKPEERGRLLARNLVGYMEKVGVEFYSRNPINTLYDGYQEYLNGLK